MSSPVILPIGSSCSPASIQRVFTVSDIFSWYAKTVSRADASAEGEKERRRVRAIFAADYGDRPYLELRPYHLVEWLQARAPNRAVNTRKRWIATVNRPFNYAAEVGKIDWNPLRGVRLGRGNEGRDWTDEEYREILRHSSPAFRRVVVFWRLSGARPGEARQLQWCDVRPERKAIVQDKHKTAHVTRAPRVIPFNGPIVKLLSWCKRKNPPGSRFVFLNAYGRPWRIKSLTEYLDLVRQRARLSPAVKCHGGRHTFATNAVINGVDLATLAKLLGHTSVATTQRYVHLADKRTHLNDAMERAIGRLPSR